MAETELREFGWKKPMQVDIANVRSGFYPPQGEGLCINVRHKVEYGRSGRSHGRTAT